ncbi:MAG: class A beta-lactamase-related serine hydrolase [Candidatus Saccharicenans sp.]|jgi:beta-lactamase class A|nr:class A beta-lactamase-related serine hydrolase [Candidatus Saccharicenans sp.]MDH7576142.1 class A beta-lactamase-related serine hydrolase [Candidatus Saccharicenans sp.]
MTSSRQKILVGLAISLVVLTCIHLQAEDKVAQLEKRLRGQLAAIGESLDGVLGLAVRDLSSGQSYFLNENEVFPQASSIKIAILLEVLKQAEENRLKLEEFIDLKPESKVGGGPILNYLGYPALKISIRDLCVLMVVLSDNTATNLLIDRVGMEAVNTRLTSLGLKQTRLRRKMMDLKAAEEGRENISTPREMLTLLERVWQGKVLGTEHRQIFFDLLSLPKDSPLQQAVPEGVTVADKPGELEAVRCDSGLVFLKKRPYIICVMTTYLAPSEDGNAVIRKIGRLVYNHFDRLERSSEYGRIISER